MGFGISINPLTVTENVVHGVVQQIITPRPTNYLVIMRIGLIAGNGQFPILFSRAAKAKGYRVFAVAHKNETDSGLNDHVDTVEWIHVGQIKRIIKFFKINDINQAVLVGGITKTKMFSDLRPDTKAISLIADMRHTHDDGILSLVLPLVFSLNRTQNATLKKVR